MKRGVALVLAAMVGLAVWFAGGRTGPHPQRGDERGGRSPAGRNDGPIGGRGRDGTAGDDDAPTRSRSWALGGSARDFALLSGRVVDALDGQPIPQVQLSLEADGEDLGRVVSDEAGAFRIRGPVGPAQLRVQPPAGFALADPDDQRRRVWLERDGGTPITLRLTRRRTIRVLVRSLEGDRVEGAEIAGEGPGATSVKTGADGGAAMAVVLGERLLGSHPEHGQGEARVTLAHLNRERLLIRLVPDDAGPTDARWARLFGQVVRDDTDEPVPEAQIRVSRGPYEEPRGAVSDMMGAFELQVAASGRYTVDASHADYGTARLRSVRPGSESVVLRLQPAGGIEGVVLDHRNEPVSLFEIRWAASTDGLAERPLGRQTFAAPDGTFLLEPVAAGQYAVEASARDRAPTKARRVSVPEYGRARVELRFDEPGRVTGIVVDDVDDRPLPGVRVRVEGFGGGSGGRTGPDGTFSLELLTPGRRSVVAAAEGYRTKIVSALDVQPGATLGPLQIRLARRGGDDEPSLDLVGIGAVLESSDGVLQIRRITDGGGAAAAGLQPGDRITHVDGRSVQELGFDGSIQAIRGTEGTTVQLTLDRDGTDVLMTVPRKALST